VRHENGENSQFYLKRNSSRTNFGFCLQFHDNDAGKKNAPSFALLSWINSRKNKNKMIKSVCLESSQLLQEVV